MNALKGFALLLVALLSTPLWGQQMTKYQIEKQTATYLPGSLQTLREFLAIPNDGHYPEQIAANLEWCRAKFESIGFTTKVLTSDGVPHLFAQRGSNPARKSVLFYMQIDGQPVDKSKWNQPDPFVAVVKNVDQQPVDWSMLKSKIDPDYKIFARSASDSKGPAMCLITALQIMQEMKLQADYNIKVIMDFQEEMGSPTIPRLVLENRELLSADRLLILDGTRHISNLPTLNYGARGIATMTLTVYGAKENLHSGQYGNYAPNPAFTLARILASMKAPDGKVLIKGFYEGVSISETDKKAFAQIPEDLPELNKRLGIARPEALGQTYEEAMQYPTLNIRGMQSGWIGSEVRTVIPATATAEIDIRLVPEITGQKMVDLVKAHLLEQGVELLDNPPTDQERAQYPQLATFKYKLGSKPFRTDMDSELGRWLNRAMPRAVDQHINIRATGGSQPIATFIETLDVPAVSVRIPNPDNNIHGPNENIRIGNYMEGIKMCLAVLTENL